MDIQVSGNNLEEDAKIAASLRDQVSRLPGVADTYIPTVGNSSVLGNYAAAGIDVELPLWTGGLLSTRGCSKIVRGKSRL